MKKLRKIFNNTYVLYSIIFLITSLLVFLPFILSNKSFIWKQGAGDGLVQNYNVLIYYGKYLRYIITHFKIPMWHFNFGQGADIITTIHYYCLGDPLNLLSIFIPEQYTEYLYEFLIILRMYLAGLTFILYCHYMKKEDKYSVIGSIIYVFCGYTMVYGIRHPYFINPMIYLPLLLIGVEKIYKKESPIIFILMVFLSCVSNFYFFYILCILVIIYSIFRFFNYNYTNYIKQLIKTLFRFIIYGLIGVLMASFILIPVIILFTNTSRSQDSAFIPMLYNYRYYMNLFFGGLSVEGGSYGTFRYYLVITLISIALLYSSKGNGSLKIAFIILTLMLCIPYVGSIMNGFSYVGNRWIFAYSMLLAYIVVNTLPNIYNINSKQIITIIIFTSIYCIGSFVNGVNNTYSNHISVIYLIITIILIFISYKSNKIKSIIYLLIFTLVILNISTNAKLKYNSNNAYNYIGEFMDSSKSYNKLNNSRYKLMNTINDNSFYRVDESINGKVTNSGLLNNYSTLGFYYSLGSGYTSDYFKEMQNVNYLSSKYDGVNYRTFLNTLASSKYFITNTKFESNVPYGYKLIKEESNTLIYKNNYYLPLGYTYKYTLKHEDYTKLTPLQKQEALLQSAIINEGSNKYNQKDINYHQEKLNYKIINNKNIEISNNKIKVKKDNSKLQIKINKSIDGELYLSFNNLYYLGNENNANFVKLGIKTTSTKDIRNIQLRTPYNIYYNGTKDYTLNLGYSKKTPKEITIKFSNAGEYKLDSMKLYVQFMKDYSSYINKLKENTLENIKINDNEVTGNISLNKNKLLCLTIPYSTGWKAYVDGKEVELKRVNTMYMGIDLDSGKHIIKLEYSTPGLKLGGIASSIGVIGLLVIIFINKKSLNKDYNIL